MANRNYNKKSSNRKNYNKNGEDIAYDYVKKFKKKYPIYFYIIVAVLVIAFLCIFIFPKYFCEEKNKPIEGEISFHFLMLGNKYSGDCIYIRAGDNDILIDAGSRVNSKDTIKNYVNQYCTDGVLEYVIATHADRDHIACFGCNSGIFDSYKCKTIIDFPKTDSTTETYQNYIAKLNNEVSHDGAVHYTALECYKNENGAQRVYNLTDTVTMEILYNYYYDHTSSDENNYSVCLLFTHGDRKFLFTGDLEKEGEEEFVKNYPIFGQVELYKAGHHGSKTSSNSVFLSIIQPKICVVSCNAGNDEFTQEKLNMFPTQDFINRISSYTEKVYVTTLADPAYTGEKEYLPFNGNVVVISEKEQVKVKCSDNDTLLKDTKWFKENRNIPSVWLS